MNYIHLKPNQPYIRLTDDQIIEMMGDEVLCQVCSKWYPSTTGFTHIHTPHDDITTSECVTCGKQYS